MNVPPPARLLYSTRTFADIIYRAELERLAAVDNGLTVIHTLTRQHPPGWSGGTRRIDRASVMRWSKRPKRGSPWSNRCGRAKDRLRLALASTDTGTWDWDLNAGVFTWDERMRELWGVGPDEPDVLSASISPERIHEILQRANFDKGWIEALLSRRHHPRTARLDPMHPEERAGRAIGYPTPGDRDLPLGDREGPILGRVRRQLVDSSIASLRARPQRSGRCHAELPRAAAKHASAHLHLWADTARRNRRAVFGRARPGAGPHQD